MSFARDTADAGAHRLDNGRQGKSQRQDDWLRLVTKYGHMTFGDQLEALVG